MFQLIALAAALGSFAIGLEAQVLPVVPMDDRLRANLTIFQNADDCREAVDKAVEIRRVRPGDYWSLVEIQSCIFKIAPAEEIISPKQIAPPETAYLDQAEASAQFLLDYLDAVFSMENKPLEIPADQFRELKVPMQAFAQGTLGYVYLQKKHYERAEAELSKALQLDPTQSQFALFLAEDLLAQQRTNREKQSPALFYLARVAMYDGPNAIPRIQREAWLKAITRAYNGYHGSAEGLANLLELARTQAFPPVNFWIRERPPVVEHARKPVSGVR